MSFLYNLSLASRSIRRSPGLSLLMIVSIGLGIAAALTTFAVFAAVSGDPIPWKSSKLFVPQIDFWGPEALEASKGEPPAALSYMDAMALLRDHRATLQSAMYQIVPWVLPDGSKGAPISSVGHAVTHEFFSLLDIPFVAGSGWGQDDDERGAAVAVISQRLSQRLYGSTDSTGRLINVTGKLYQIKGVMSDWHPQPRYYDLFNTGGFTAAQDDILVPFTHAIATQLRHVGSTACRDNPGAQEIKDLLGTNCAWVAYMVQLDDSVSVGIFRDYLDSYAAEQRRIGRFNWKPNNRLRNLKSWLDYRKVVPKEAKTALSVAIGLLLACLISTSGLLLSQYLRRSGEVGVRRALGAPRKAIYSQFLVEAGVVGFLGGILGLLLTTLSLMGLPKILPEGIAALIHLNGSMIFITLFLAMTSTMAASLYPILLVAKTKIGWQINVL